MAKLQNNQCRSIIYRYFLCEGWLPQGTTPTNWAAVKMGDMLIDDPPLPHDPFFQRMRISCDLQHFFVLLGSSLIMPFEQLKNDELTLGELADWCFNNQGQ
jgi:hypothetical protein